MPDQDKPQLYAELVEQLSGLLSGEDDPVANAANTSALLMQSLPGLNWAGFYFLRKRDELVLGPFQGKPACVRIGAGQGVCGAAVARRQSVLVEDVHAFPGHIACDAASRSELVVPLIRGDVILGVIDLDSPTEGRFDADDQSGIEAVAPALCSSQRDARFGCGLSPLDADGAPSPTGPEPAVAQSGRRGTVFVYALACGVMVGNLYICQPLLDELARSFNVAEPVAGLVSVAAQVGYALGILLLVPLADIAQPRRLLRWLILMTTAGLLAAAAAPGVAVLIAGTLVFAAATVVPQILVPLGASLVPPERRGRVIAALQTGFVLGILLSRTVSGAIATLAGSWRAPFLLAALGTGALFFVVPRYLPVGAPARARSYGALLGSLPPLLRHAALRTSMALGFCLFGAFSAFWSTLAFHLASPAFASARRRPGCSACGARRGAIVAPMFGRLADRLGPRRVNAVSLACAGLAFVCAGILGATSIWALVVAVNLLDFGLQSGQIANQIRIFKLGDAIRARVNTVYMVGVFGGGAVGSLAGTLAWDAAGWPGVCGLACGLIGMAGLILASTGRSIPSV